MAQTLVSLADIESISWTTLQTTLRNHYTLVATTMVSRNEFYHRCQREGQTINEFVVNLREIATKCGFINPEEMMKDHIILRMRDLNLQKKVLIKWGATFKDIVEEAQATESSNNLAADIHRTSGVQREGEDLAGGTDSEGEGDLEEAIHRVHHNRRVSPQDMDHEASRCVGCMGFYHRAVCRFKEAICRRCQRKGHIAEACRATQPTPTQPRS